MYASVMQSGYFNPRSYKRSDAGMGVGTEGVKISIHAPTRGATVHRFIYRICLNISIHAPTRGATLLAVFLAVSFFISIHAPTRGATAKMHNNPYTYL